MDHHPPTTPTAIDPATRIGVVSISVADLERSLAFYQDSIGLRVLEHAGNNATLGVGTLPLLHLQHTPGARIMRRATGLYHFALRVPTRRDLANVIQHFRATTTVIAGASDHLVSEAIYLNDPDGHGIEVYRDRPRETWYDQTGRIQMDNQPLDIAGILGELGGEQPTWQGLPEGSDLGHIHLQVADVAAAEQFYVGILGFEHMADYPQAAFISAGGYHHHIGMNTWAGIGVPPPPANAARLLSYEIVLPTAGALGIVVDRLYAANQTPIEADGGWLIPDPAGNLIRLRATADH